MPLQQVDVKTYTRRGKLVKSYKRKQDKKNLLLKTAIGTASVLGISVASYLVLKKRYIGNLDKVANVIKANPNVGKVLDDSKDNMLFTLGGFAAKGENSKGEAIIMNKVLKQSVGKEAASRTEFVALKHDWSTGKEQKYYEEGIKPLRYLTSVPQPTLKSISKGRNDEAIKQAEDIWSWVVKNPKKKVKLVGISAGGQMVKDIEYILKKKGVDVETVTVGNFDNKMHKMSTSLNIVNKNDTLVKLLQPRNVTYANVKKYPGFGENHYLGNLIYLPKKESEKTPEINKSIMDVITKHLKIN